MKKILNIILVLLLTASTMSLALADEADENNRRNWINAL
jgi:uncharacterized protein YxeA